MKLREMLGLPAGTRLSYEIIGDLALLDYEGDLPLEKVAEALMQLHKNVKAVFRKQPVAGVFRVRKPEYIAGERRSYTVHKESGCAFELDIARVYFSPRLAYERERIAALVQPGERVMVLFAGVGPYPIVISKKTGAQTFGVELNPWAYYYFRKNVVRNKLEDRIIPIYGDVRRVVYHYPRYFHRVVMPLPMGAEHFLKEGLHILQRPGWLHTYLFVERGTEAARVDALVRAAGASEHRWRVVRPYSASIVQLAVDLYIKD